MKAFLKKILPVVDLLIFPVVLLSAFLLGVIRRAGVQRMRFSRRMLNFAGVFPIRRHYYEPRFDLAPEELDFVSNRSLPALDLNVEGQLAFLKGLIYSEETLAMQRGKGCPGEFGLDNGAYGPGEAECWYQVIRNVKPKRIIEIGSGNSTLVAVSAVEKNAEEDPGYFCEHICVEPYEMPWLEQIGVSVLRKKVEDVNLEFFDQLEAGDILFIDSSHVIRPGGDVLCEYLQIIPGLAPGVIVHIHDIFTPREYLREWLVDEVRLWNEQYLLEAFLSSNRDWEVLLACNFLHHNYPRDFKEVAPHAEDNNEPSSLYIRKVG